MYVIVKNSNGCQLSGCDNEWLWLANNGTTFDSFEDADDLLVRLDITGIAHIEQV